MHMHPLSALLCARPTRLLIAGLATLCLLGPAPATRAAPTSFLVTKFIDTADGVCDSANCSLREAIVAANSNPGDDVIIMPSGTFTLSLAGANENQGATGDIDILGNLEFRTNGAATTIVTGEAGWADRIFHVGAGTTARLAGLTISGGQQPGGSGGGLLNQGTLVLSNSVVLGNSAAFGGGVASSGALTLVGTTISGNSASDSGGGIFSGGALTLNTSTIEGNGAGGAGGGVAASGQASLVGSTLSGNTAGGAGGGLNSSATLEAAGSTLSGNTAGGAGGGLANSGNASLTNITLSGNTASSGGGLSNASSATLRNVTVARNTASGGSGGGVANDSGASLQLSNSLIGENNGADPDCAGTLSSQGYNLIGALTNACSFSLASGDLTNADALLLSLRDNDGPSRTHALLPSSPAIDAGSPGGASACAASDQRGLARPQTGRCDIGAFELVGVTIIDRSFQPKNLIIRTGTTLRWKNLDGKIHNTISTIANESWNSPELDTGDVFMHTFNISGVFSYFCAFHKDMEGTITVVGQPVTPTPLLTQLSPSSALAGSPELTLTLTGLDFDVDGTADWGGTLLDAPGRSAQVFIVTVPAALLATPGIVDVRVINPAATGGASNALKFRIVGDVPLHTVYVPLARR